LIDVQAPELTDVFEVQVAPLFVETYNGMLSPPATITSPFDETATLRQSASIFEASALGVTSLQLSPPSVDRHTPFVAPIVLLTAATTEPLLDIATPSHSLDTPTFPQVAPASFDRERNSE
jgi:hypothetical protein